MRITWCRHLLAVTFSLAAMFQTSDAAAAFTYTYTGNPFTYYGNTDPSQLAYSDQSSIKFSFTTPTKIDSFAALSTFSQIPWTFSDGTQAFTSEQGYQLSGWVVGSADAATKGPFSRWEIRLDASASCTQCAVFLNTTNDDARVYDWGQNRLFNYGGNWDSPGQWQVAVSPVPEPATPIMMMSGLGMFAFIAARRRRVSVPATYFGDALPSTKQK